MLGIFKALIYEIQLSKRCIELLSTSFVTKPSAENACTNNEIYMYLTLFILILFSDYVIKVDSKTI